MKTQTKIAVTTGLAVLFLLSSAALAEFYLPQASSSPEKETHGFVYTSANSPFASTFASSNDLPRFSLLEQDLASTNAEPGKTGEGYLLKMTLPEQGFASLAFSIAYQPLANLTFSIALSSTESCLYDGAMLLLKDQDQHQVLLSLDCQSFAERNYLDFAALLSNNGSSFIPDYLELEIHAHSTASVDYRLTELILNS